MGIQAAVVVKIEPGQEKNPSSKRSRDEDVAQRNSEEAVDVSKKVKVEGTAIGDEGGNENGKADKHTDKLAKECKEESKAEVKLEVKEEIKEESDDKKQCKV